MEMNHDKPELKIENTHLMAKQNRKIWLVVFLLVFCMVFYFLQIHTPLQLDDLEFMWMKGLSAAGVQYSECRIETFGDYINFMEAHRVSHNGRLADAFAVFVLNFISRWAFALLNTAIGLLTVVMISRLIFNSVTPYLLIVIIAALLLCLPNIPATVFWLCGTCNYTWGACIMLIFLLLYKSFINSSENRGVRLYACLILGVICGAYHEALGLPLLFAFSIRCLYVYYKTRCLNKDEVYIITALLIGAIICISAPGVSSRVNSSLSVDPAKQLFKQIIVCSLCLPTVFLFIVSLFKERCKNLDIVHLLFVIGSIILVGGVVFIAGGGGALIHGGLRYYLCFGCLLVALEAFQSTIFRNKVVVCAGASVVVACWLVVNIPANVNLSRIVDSASENKIYNSTVVVDVTKNKQLYDGRILHSLPSSPVLMRRGLSLRGEKCYVVLSAMMPDFNVLSEKKNSEDSPLVMREKSGNWIIRLPQDYVPFQDEPLDIMNQRGQLCALALPFYCRQPVPAWCSTIFYKISKNVSNCYKYSIYHDRTTFYVILDSDVPDNVSVNVEVMNKRNFSKSKIMFKLTLEEQDQKE